MNHFETMKDNREKDNSLLANYEKIAVILEESFILCHRLNESHEITDSIYKGSLNEIDKLKQLVRLANEFIELEKADPKTRKEALMKMLKESTLWKKD